MKYFLISLWNEKKKNHSAKCLSNFQFLSDPKDKEKEDDKVKTIGCFSCIKLRKKEDIKAKVNIAQRRVDVEIINERNNRDKYEVCGCSLDAKKVNTATSVACCPVTTTGHCVQCTGKCVYDNREDITLFCCCALITATAPVSVPLIAACIECCNDRDHHF